MGLDMYAYAVAKGDVIDDFSFEKNEVTEIAYWRKFNAFHGWMEDLYRNIGGTAESFNCVPVLLTAERLDMLESQLGELKPREGFFFGSQEVYPEDIEDLREFITKARACIADGQAVYYDSWW